MELREQALAEQSQKGQETVINLIRSLSDAIVYPDAGNFVTNRKLWDLYAQDWDPEREWVRKMAANLDRDTTSTAEGDGAPQKHYLGEEWSLDSDVDDVVCDFIQPNVNGNFRVLDVGCGGGRLAVRVAPLVGELVCVDISENMLEKARVALQNQQNVSFILLQEPRLDREVLGGSCDMIVCFDVMVHMDLHLFHCYLWDFFRMLKPGGFAFISTADVTSEDGYGRFAKQKDYSVGGFYFMCPEMVRSLAGRCGFQVVREAPQGSRNTYYARDYLVLLQKPMAAASSTSTGQ
eukprot:gnl/TRDRNA2_/TRDRNA2_159736_c0_seq1.p1 gnl/TRDRNA2_/TRDRNA2_159736_c0~~gnl/TRDRNA2_/TRDRNA2_159736_c0_seq1.p1  ORF type:complete len:292 (-),score=58.89 gnl/TRDRNA2_/TRDRNA2_159736_c0_seq1:100-975(-)